MRTTIPMLTIRSIRARCVSVPMREPHRAASGTITESPPVFTNALTEEGVQGHNYVFCYSALALRPVALLVQALEAAVSGRSAAPVEIRKNGRLQPVPHTLGGDRPDPRTGRRGLVWIEEPTLAEKDGVRARFARAARMPIQAGENWWGAVEMRKAIEAEASDLLMLDVTKVGGVTGWPRAAALAKAHGLRVSNHLFPEVSAQLLCVTPAAHWLEYAEWFNPILEQPLRIEAGRAIPDERPGSGVNWDEAAVARHLVE